MDNTLYHLASEQNDPAAQYLLGRKYFTGSTVEKNVDEAIKWFKLAAAQNHSKAQFQLGKMYLYGEEGVKKNYVYALGYLRDAAVNNYAEAQYELGNYYLMGKAENVDYAKALKWYRAAAAQQHVRAMVALGGILYEGKGGIKPRPDEAKHYLSLAAEFGDAEAIKALRKISNHTQSPARNSTSITAFHAKLNDAAAGHIPSQYEVGMAYLKGDGVDMDSELAAKWLRRAAVNDYSKAQYMLSHLYRDGTGVKKNRKRALEWLRIAASAGIIEAQKELQSMHLSNNSLDEFDEPVDTASLAEKNKTANTLSTAVINDSTTEKEIPTDSEKPATEHNPSTKTEQKQSTISLSKLQLGVPQLELQPTVAEDQFQLANRYLTGDKTTKDIKRALYWFEQAAAQYHPAAQYQLGKMYKDGTGVTASAAKAKYWLSKASDAGYDKADLLLKDLRDIKVSEKLNIGPPKVINTSLSTTGTHKTSDNKNTPTVKEPQSHDHDLAKNIDSTEANTASRKSDTTNNKTDASAIPQKSAMIAQLGKRQQPIKSPDNEIKWLLETAESNNEEAQLKLAEMYLTGQGVHRDIFAAAEWYQKAANLGNAEAQFKLGDLYKEGLGVEKSNSIAIMWYRKAANQGHVQAKRRLGGCRIC